MDAQGQPVDPSRPYHPFALFFHFAFKVMACVWYMICGIVNKNNFVWNFVICIVLLALDFWTVKNVTGRLLVGLRWWNEASESGDSAWRFEALPAGTRAIHPVEKYWFWMMTVANVITWAVFAVMAFIGLKWDYLLIPIIALVLGGSNMMGYYKCSGEAKNFVNSNSNRLVSGAMAASLNAAMSKV